MKIQNSGLFLFLVFFVYLFTAYNSVVYYQEDEHYQIVEFANYKMGWITADKLAWEFNAQIHPGFQPFVCFLIFKVLSAFGVADGYTLVLALRIISALLSLAVIHRFIASNHLKIQGKALIVFIVLSYLIWFIPFINVRFSSENWSGLAFLSAITLLNDNGEKPGFRNYFLTGLLLGISILLRYQSALLAFGVVLWLIFVKKNSLKGTIGLCSSILLMIFIGFFIDHWLYGKYTFPMYKYFLFNVLTDSASRYGTSPWYEIVLYALKAPGPFGIFVFFSFFVAGFRTPRNLVIWALIPLFGSTRNYPAQRTTLSFFPWLT